MYFIVWCNLHLCIIVKLRRRCLCYFSGICVKMLSLQAQTLLFALWSAVLQYFLVKIYKLKLRGVVKHVFEWHFKLFEFNLNCFSVLFLRWDFLSVLFLRFLHICISDGIFAKDCLLTGLVKSRPGLHKLCYPTFRDRSTWSKFGAHGEHGDVFLFSNLGALGFSENLIRYSLHICLREVKNNIFSSRHSYLRHFS